MQKKVRVAVIGVGFVGGQAHTPSFKKIEGSELVTICARTEKRVKPLSEKYDVKYCLDSNKVINDPNIDAIVLSLPTPLHFNLASKSLRNGKHVLCEMPIAPNIPQTKELQRIAKEENVLLMPVLNFRFAPIYQKVKEMIQSNLIGKPIAIHFREFIPASSISEQWPADSWAWNIKKSGGYPDFTLSVWSIDMIRWMFENEIKDVKWASNYPKLEKFGNIIGYNTMGLITLSNGIVGSLHFSASVNQVASTSRLEVYGDNTNVIHAIWNNKIVLYEENQKPKEWNLNVKGTKVWGHRQQDIHFIECILHNKKPKVTVDDAIEAQKISQKMVKIT